MYTKEVITVLDHDFATDSTGTIIPHGIFDLKQNKAYITLGTSKDTSEFNCECLQLWWKNVGIKEYPNADRILILMDGGGSNSSRHYIFKEDLQKLSDTIMMPIRIAHYPPYTSKYNPIEHRVFCHVTRACEGVVFKSVELVKELIDNTRTEQGLEVKTSILDKVFETGRKASEAFRNHISVIFDTIFPKWNYMVAPRM